MWLVACSRSAEPPSGKPATPEPQPAPPAALEAPLECAPGRGDCDSDRENGCETLLDDNGRHCGRCGNACGEARLCVAGGCRSGAVAVSAGGTHSCLRTAAGEVACWGLNSLGQLSLPDRKARLEPVRLPDASGVRVVSAGRYHTCLLHAGGRVRCSGDGGVLGSGHVKPQAGFRVVHELVDAVALSAGISHSCAVVRDGRAQCWGSDVAGQLGNGAPPEDPKQVEDKDLFALLPTWVSGLQDAMDIAVGGARSCALHRGGTVSCWGQAAHGRFGAGGGEDRHVPQAVGGVSDVVELAMGQFHACARTRAGELYCWGRNAYGQLGLGDRDDRDAPAKLELSEVAEVSAGLRHTCARLRDGHVLCWGENNARLGDGTPLLRELPTPVKGMTDAIAIAAGETHSCAVRADGSVMCWGDNDGQLGTGTRKPSRTPVRVKWSPPKQAARAAPGQ